MSNLAAKSRTNNPVSSETLPVDKMSDADKFLLYSALLSDKELAELPSEKILEYRKKLNPYGRTIAGSNKYLNFSITQITHEYWKKFITTSMVGYLNRMCDEWKVPNGVPVVGVYKYLEDPSALDTPQHVLDKNNESLMYDYEFNRRWMEKRIVVKEFLEEMFQFNPDEHVRSGYRPNYKDSSRTPLQTMAARIAVNHLIKKDVQLRTDKEEYDQARGIKTKKIKRTIKSKNGATRTIIREVPVNEEVTKPDETHPMPLDPANPKDPNVVSTVTNMIPPHDIFHRFKMYYQENYEELREAVKHLYCENPEFELAINAYAMHDTAEDAELFKKQHADEVISEIFTVETGKWCFFDSFKKQRESVTFYNKNTVILEEMTKQAERDERLGQDMMSKRVEKSKKMNEVEAGPDAANLKQWVAENNNLAKMGAMYLGDKADDDIPEDAVQVDVWKIAKGGVQLVKEKFYTQAEAPSFVSDSKGPSSSSSKSEV
jgi:hypothetical protein